MQTVREAEKQKSRSKRSGKSREAEESKAQN